MYKNRQASSDVNVRNSKVHHTSLTNCLCKIHSCMFSKSLKLRFELRHKFIESPFQTSFFFASKWLGKYIQHSFKVDFCL